MLIKPWIFMGIEITPEQCLTYNFVKSQQFSFLGNKLVTLKLSGRKTVEKSVRSIIESYWLNHDDPLSSGCPNELVKTIIDRNKATELEEAKKAERRAEQVAYFQDNAGEIISEQITRDTRSMWGLDNY